MTTSQELLGVIEWIKDRYPSANIYRHWENVHHDFTMIPVSAVQEAAEHHYDEGNKMAPGFPELRKAAIIIAGSKGLIDPNSNNCDVRGSHSRNWALSMTDDKGNREAECLDCGAIIIKEAHKLLTVGEAASVAKGGLGPPAPHDEITDRIAP